MYSRSFEMNRQQAYRDQALMMDGWMGGTLVYKTEGDEDWDLLGEMKERLPKDLIAIRSNLAVTWKAKPKMDIIT